ncbi:hypothetical protein [Sphingobium baderi]|uniref:Uncharacterized protein n=1 Tax=Sphingobium baderi TaxID=1332080 RepID=A0A0S3F2I5_9SPHN|nr:hypothetical protein [Sphingobium baderi]ALR21894.1 hypothetical protein ATN00_17950 [Sphingobium baderi]
MQTERRRKRRTPNLSFIAVHEDRWMDFPEIWAAELWFKFLQISPSYELARKYRAGELTGTEALPADFKAVLAVYDDLGDVQTLSDERLDRQYRFMGHFGSQPNTAQLGIVRHDSPERASDVMDGLEGYLGHQWIAEGKPSAVIAAIPLGMSKAAIMKQIEAMLDGLMPDTHILADGSPKYQAAAKRNDLPSVDRYYNVLRIKAARPKLKNWQIGVMAKLSEAHKKEHLKTRSARPDYDPTKDRNTLKELTSRAVGRGHMIAENAARGIFPDYAKCEHAVPLDWNLLHQQWRARCVLSGQRNDEFWKDINVKERMAEPVAGGVELGWDDYFQG